MGATYDHLKEMILDAAVGLDGVVPKRMFGCDALFRDKQIFALVWKEDRLGVRLPDGPAFHDAMKLEGAAPWAPMGTKGMAHWVLLPEEMHDVPEDVAAWVARAHALAAGGAAAKKRAVKKPAVKKPAVKKPAAKKPAVKKPAVKKLAVKKPAVKKIETRSRAKQPAPRKPAKKRTKR